jgi:hypothetical protein
MFAKDFNLLNKIYNKDVFIKENYGAEVDGSPFKPYEAAETILPRKGAPIRQCNKLACQTEEEEEDELIFAKKPIHGGYNKQNDEIVDSRHSNETNAYMAKQQLFRIVKMAAMLHDIINDEEELSAWIAAKISQASDDLNSVFGYKEYEQFRDQIDSDVKIEEGSEKDLYDSITKGGTNLLKTIKGNIRNESRENIEKVLYEVISALESK